MTFLWPDMLLLLLLVPVLIAGYVWLMRRKNKAALRYASLTMVRDTLEAGARFKRHIPPAVFLIGLVVLIVSMARPMAVVTLPSERGTIILAMDVSGSMQATDVDPTRISAAQAAAKAFVLAQPPTTKVGVVAFAATAFLVQTPTFDREETVRAIDRFRTQYGTAVGSGILVALHTIFPDVEFDESGFGGPPIARRGGMAAGQFGGVPLGGAAPEKDQAAFQPVPPGSYKSAVIVLLSDGRTNTGPDPIESARMAAQRGVRVFTVGFGTPNGGIAGFGGRSMYMQVDEEALKQIANMTGATFFHAESGTDLKKIYQGITTQLVMEKQQTEITAIFPAVAAIAVVLSALLSLLWFNRIA